MEYISAMQAAEKWGITVKRVQVLCKANRIPGVNRVGHMWIIPFDAEKPLDARIKNGKYIGFRNRVKESESACGDLKTKR